MEESLVKRFLEYIPPQSPEEQKQTLNPMFISSQRPSSSHSQQYQLSPSHQRQPSYQQHQQHSPYQQQHHHRHPHPQQQSQPSPQQPYQTTSPLHHYRFPSQTFQHPGGMACSPSPASSSASSPRLQTPPPRPHSGPKAKFTLEDDALLMELKEKHDMTWKRISEFFPGRSSGTLQVRYCTKLKAKNGAWTEDLVGRLNLALHEYESEKWRIVSSKVGNGFSAAACKQKTEELEAKA